jgi:hypothetical protein|tara:strand:- start:359 stop:640 length:282 start_codon:yes stop_codon:yes gene_type:complete
MRRNSSTIPFGYRLDTDDKTLIPVVKEIESLNEMKDGVKSGAFSLRGAVDILEHQTGRKLSAMGLKKIMDKDIPAPTKEESKGLLSRDDKETV